MSAVYSVGWEGDHLSLPSEFLPPTAPSDWTRCSVPLLDAAAWVDASQDSDCPDSATQRLPIKAASGPALTAAVGPNRENLEFLKGYVQRPSQFDADEEPDNVPLQSTIGSSQASMPTESQMHFIMQLAGDFVDSQMEAVAPEVIQEDVELGESQQAESDASSDNELPDDDEEMEAADDYVDSQAEAVAAEVMQEDVESGDSQRTASAASSDNELPEEPDEAETVEQRPAKRHSCDYCDYRTSVKSHLTYHVRTHTGSKPFRCGQCGYRAAQPETLAVHLRTHTGERPYPCEQCDYRAADHSCLAVHKRKHTGLKPYACHYGSCGYRAADTSRMRKHLRTHTGEKPYTCSQCGYKATQKAHLNRHIRRMH